MALRPGDLHVTGFTMDYQLTVNAILHRAETHFHSKTVVSELPDQTMHCYTYRDMTKRAKQLAVALQSLGIRPGDRVATLCWNHYRHLETFFGIPACGAVLHPLNLRLHANDLTYIANHADDQVIVVDEALLPILESFRANVPFKHVIVITANGNAPAGMLDYEQQLTGAPESAFVYPDLSENDPAAMCYTSGTTGQPKGVMYTHRALALHTLTWAQVDSAGIGERDVVLPMAPMFHANAWGLPFVCAMVGAKLVLAGPHADPGRLLHLVQNERVTFSCGVPTIWLAALHHLDSQPGAFDLKHLKRVVVAGSAVPKSLIQGLQERHGIEVIQLWGMTEMAPVGTFCPLPSDLTQAASEDQWTYRARQGVPVPLVEIRARAGSTIVPWDGKTPGELEVRGAWVAGSYYNGPEAAGSFTEDGWFRTGDIVNIDPRGCIQIVDRAKDLIKSGGEWISSVALENALMAHPAVAEAAVVAVAHEKWQERPLAAVVLKPGKKATPDELIGFLASSFAKWWLPDAVVFLEQIPRTSAGKFLKKALRERFKDYLLNQVER